MWFIVYVPVGGTWNTYTGLYLIGQGQCPLGIFIYHKHAMSHEGMVKLYNMMYYITSTSSYQTR